MPRETLQWFDTAAPCKHCRRETPGALGLRDGVFLADSHGFMVFKNGVVCDACLRGRYGSDGTETATLPGIPALAELFVKYEEGERS